MEVGLSGFYKQAASQRIQIASIAKKGRKFTAFFM